MGSLSSKSNNCIAKQYKYRSDIYAIYYIILYARVAGDRPDIVPKGSVNLAFIGNFAESPSNDTVFTTEYSIRTAMESVYTLLEVERAVPEVYGSIYDIRELLKAIYYMGDKKTIDEANLGIPKLAKVVLKKRR